MRADGSDQHVIARARGYYQGPAWSPNAYVIAYQSSPGRDKNITAIFTIRPNGTDERQLTPGSASAGFPAWSPSGSRIAYASSNRLWVMSSHGTKPHPVTNCRPPCVYDYAPAWSPTGSELVFVRQQDGGAARRLYVLSSPPTPSGRIPQRYVGLVHRTGGRDPQLSGHSPGRMSRYQWVATEEVLRGR